MNNRDRDRFPLTTEYEGGQAVRYWTPACDDCGYPTKIRHTGKNLPSEALRQIVRKRGWDVGQHFRCKRCIEGKKPMAPQARRAAYLKLAGAPRPALPEHTPKVVPMTAKPIAEPVVAEAPPTPTLAHRKRIREELEGHYDEEKQRYREGWSDKSLAAHLNVPAAWVAEAREVNGFGPDRSQNDEEMSGKLFTLEVEVITWKEKAFAAATKMEELEGEIKRIKLQLSYAA